MTSTRHHGSIPVSAIIATRNRPMVLLRTLHTLSLQSQFPAEVVIVDSSDNSKTVEACESMKHEWPWRTKYLRATVPGAATQRNQGVEHSIFPVILFMDDDIVIQPSCIARLWQALSESENTGGASAMITNQAYHAPGRLGGFVFAFLNGKGLASYAGRCFGPGLAQLPGIDTPGNFVDVDWLNAGCTLYRRCCLPDPVFPAIFEGASTAEDLALSLQVGRKWKLVNVPRARIYHDSQPGDHKKSVSRLAAMELVNKHFIMRSVLGRKGITDYLKFAIMMGYQFAGTLTCRRGLGEAPARITGFGIGIYRILFAH
ncbi:MAG: glycosyltransferase involved in cell wall biosynthesis [Verrucomicrobiales bacterium]|jgi:glycosyltransferase involved in cell wall biosynthesis